NDECPTNAPPMTKGKIGKRNPSAPPSLVGHSSFHFPGIGIGGKPPPVPASIGSRAVGPVGSDGGTGSVTPPLGGRGSESSAGGAGRRPGGGATFVPELVGLAGRGGRVSVPDGRK